uniref:hypothetical protein n=1 Tax=Acetatifactor sp. TaxID=1872090 RepID=UPI004056CDDF
MQKIKNSVLAGMMQAGLSRAEMDFLIYISRYQDNKGHVCGLYYKDVCPVLDISYQTFYDVIHNLKKKGIIDFEKKCYGDWDITIKGNAFEDEYSGYISTGDDIFSNKEFWKCKPAEKLLAMEFLKITKNPQNGGKYRTNREEFLKKYCQLFRVTRRILLRYMKSLKQFFSIGIKDGVYYIRPLQNVAKKTVGKKDKELLQEHVSSVVFRRQRATYTESECRDTAKLLIQYADKLKDDMLRIFSDAVYESIRRRNEGIKNKYKWNRDLKPKFVHKILQEMIPQC